MKKIFVILILIINMYGEEEIIDDKYSLLKKETAVYYSYVGDLIKEKKMTKNEIKEILKSKERTVTSNLLKGLDLDFNKNKINEAKEYYDEIIIKVANKIKNSTEALYISDYLMRRGKYDIIKNILTIEYCESLMDKEKMGKCSFYLYVSKNKTNEFTRKEKDILEKYPKLWEIANK